jgi:hypothetical protein
MIGHLWQGLTEFCKQCHFVILGSVVLACKVVEIWKARERGVGEVSVGHGACVACTTQLECGAAK